jgi:hypothetical protein
MTKGPKKQIGQPNFVKNRYQIKMEKSNIPKVLAGKSKLSKIGCSKPNIRNPDRRDTFFNMVIPLRHA